MEPGHEDREYRAAHFGDGDGGGASMEPGHEDREYDPEMQPECIMICEPQWSPVMKTGNTCPSSLPLAATDEPQWSPVMKTGNTWRTDSSMSVLACLNGARS